MLLALLIVAALIAIVYGQKAGQNFMNSALFTIGLVTVTLFGIGIALYVTDQKQSKAQRSVAPQTAALAPSYAPAPAPPAAESSSPAAVAPPSAEDERIYREVDKAVKTGNHPKTDKEWDAALSPYAGQ